MEIALRLLVLVGGLGLALVASGYAVTYTRALAAALGAPSFVVGVALVSIGTDLPEIANAVAAHLRGEGDINVGTAVGSALVQYTFIVGLFPLVIAVIAVRRREVLVVAALTMAGLALTSLLVLDGRLIRWEGALLIVAWVVFLALVVVFSPGLLPEDLPEPSQQRKLVQAAIVLVALVVVGAGATVAVDSLIVLAELVGIPEFVLGFFGASIGTSAPELIVDLRALAAGAPGIAFGDAFGSSLVDATLTVGIGGVVAPADVTPHLAVTGALYSLVAVGVVGGLLAVRRRHDRVSGAVFVGLYAFAYVVVLSAR
ncbi:MAG: sodium:calcium antiporter [Thermoleophilia bacterium]|nr:sodium:calcium antiporter [Thermoleophilia bacterium]